MLATQLVEADIPAPASDSSPASLHLGLPAELPASFENGPRGPTWREFCGDYVLNAASFDGGPEGGPSASTSHTHASFTIGSNQREATFSLYQGIPFAYPLREQCFFKTLRLSLACEAFMAKNFLHPGQQAVHVTVRRLHLNRGRSSAGRLRRVLVEVRRFSELQL